MLVGQKIARATLAMMIFLGISSRREMAAQGGRCHTDLSTDMAKRTVLRVTLLGGEFARGYR